MAVPGCTKSNFDLAWETNEDKLKLIPYSACLPGGGVFLYSVIVPTTPALRNITKSQTFPRARFHALIDEFSAGLLSAAYLPKCQARNSLSHLRLKIFSPFVKSDKGIISLQIYSAFTVIKATRVEIIVTPSTVWQDFTFLLYPYKYIPITRIDQDRFIITVIILYRDYAGENWEPGQKSGRWCKYAAWLTIIAASSHLAMIQGGKERTEGRAERAGISNGKIRCMTIRYIIVRYF